VAIVACLFLGLLQQHKASHSLAQFAERLKLSTPHLNAL
jgi:hypothetical protein